MARVGIYSGTFDPIHNGHMSFALAAMSRASLSAVVFLVEPEPRGKTPVATLQQRRDMVRLAIADYPELSLAEPLGEAQFTLERTVPKLTERYGNDLAFLIGSDVCQGLHAWPGFAEAAKTAHWIVGIRDSDPDISTYVQPDKAVVIHVDHENPGLASRTIRANKSLLNVHAHPAVAEYASTHALYY
jgi:nicotinate-nucleotide adenylyltransferase